MCKKQVIIPDVVGQIITQSIDKKQYPNVETLVKKNAIKNSEHRYVLEGYESVDDGRAYDWIYANSDDVMTAIVQLKNV